MRSAAYVAACRHPVEAVGDVRQTGLPAGRAVADGVARRAQLEGLGGVARSDRQVGRVVLLQELRRRRAEQRHGGDVVGHAGRKRLRYHRRGYAGRRLVGGDVSGDDRALGVAAEHDLGVRAVRGRGLHVRSGVPDPVDDGGGEGVAVGEVVAGRVVDRVDVERPRAQMRAQGVDERLADSADAGCLAGASREDELYVRAGRGRRGCGRMSSRGSLRRRRRLRRAVGAGVGKS